jgi:hypothetical protein
LPWQYISISLINVSNVFSMPDGQTNSSETYPAAVLDPAQSDKNLHGQKV